MEDTKDHFTIDLEDDTQSIAYQTFNPDTGKHEVVVPPLYPIHLFKTAFHELGHAIGEELNFQKRDVLTPDEVKSTSVQLSHEEIEYFQSIFHRTSDGEIEVADRIEKLDGVRLELILKILKAYSKNNIDLNNLIEVETPSIREVKQRIVDNYDRISTLEKSETGEIEAVSSREGRDDEMDSHAAEYACAAILTNTLRKYYFLKSHEYITIELSDSPSHRRAQKIVERAYARTGWILPSSKDIEDRAV